MCLRIVFEICLALPFNSSLCIKPSRHCCTNLHLGNYSVQWVRVIGTLSEFPIVICMPSRGV